jgi:hypothetical protein
MQRFIFRSRVAGHAPDVLRELLALRDILRLLMRPSSFEGTAGMAALLQLLGHLQQQGPGSPWGALLQELQGWQQQQADGQLSDEEMQQKLDGLDALAYCIDSLHVWLPNDWLELTGATVS